LCGTTKKQIKYKGRNGLEKNKQNAHNKLRQFANKNVNIKTMMNGHHELNKKKKCGK